MSGDWVAIGLGGLAGLVYVLFLSWEKRFRRKEQKLLQERFGEKEESA